MIAMIRKFLELAGERKKQLYLAWLFQALTSICEGAIYFMLFLAIKDILGGSFTREKLIQYSLMFLVYTVLHFVFYYFTIAKQRPVSYAMMRDERLSIAAKIKQFPLYYFTKDKISQLTSLFTTDLSFVEMNIMEIIAGFVSSMIMTVVFALMLLSVDWRMALLLFVGIIPGYILYQQFQKSMVQLGEQKKNAQVAMIDSTLEYVQGMETIKAYRLEQTGKLVENQVDGYCTASGRYESTLTNWSMGYKICLNLGLFLSLGVGITMVRSGSLASATYLFFAIMGIIFYRPLEALMGSFAMINLANASLDNIAEINNLPTENEKQGITQFADTQADVRFENVSFIISAIRKITQIPIIILTDASSLLCIPFRYEYYLKKEIHCHNNRSVEMEIYERILRELKNFPEIPRLILLHSMLIGLRISEVCTLKGDAYSWQGRDAWIQVYQMKMRTYKRVPIPDVLYKIMKRYLEKYHIGSEDYVFQNKRGGAYQYGSFKWQMKELFNKRQDIFKGYDFKSHDFRHTIATLLYDDEVPLQSIRDYLGHDYEEMTQQYVDFMPKKISAANQEFFKKGENSLASGIKKCKRGK